MAVLLTVAFPVVILNLPSLAVVLIMLLLEFLLIVTLNGITFVYDTSRQYFGL